VRGHLVCKERVASGAAAGIGTEDDVIEVLATAAPELSEVPMGDGKKRLGNAEHYYPLMAGKRYVSSPFGHSSTKTNGIL
jgi:hypothetical protein